MVLAFRASAWLLAKRLLDLLSRVAFGLHGALHIGCGCTRLVRLVTYFVILPAGNLGAVLVTAAGGFAFCHHVLQIMDGPAAAIMQKSIVERGFLSSL